MKCDGRPTPALSGACQRPRADVGIKPFVTWSSQASFDSARSPAAQRVREARAILTEHDPSPLADDEMRGAAAPSKGLLDSLAPGPCLPAGGRVPMMPSLDAASAGITVGSILRGTARPVHILEPGASVHRIVNMTALAVIDANQKPAGKNA